MSVEPALEPKSRSSAASASENVHVLAAPVAVCLVDIASMRHPSAGTATPGPVKPVPGVVDELLAYTGVEPISTPVYAPTHAHDLAELPSVQAGATVSDRLHR